MCSLGNGKKGNILVRGATIRVLNDKKNKPYLPRAGELVQLMRIPGGSKGKTEYQG